MNKSTIYKNDAQTKTALQASPNGAFSEGQATDFTNRYSVLNQFRDESTIANGGFSATLFLDKSNPNRLVLSFAGTEFETDALRDGLVTDVQIGIVGYAKPQALAMYRYIKQLQTAGGAAVNYSEAEIRSLYLLDGNSFSPLSGTDVLFNTFKAKLQADKGIEGGAGGAALMGSGQEIDVAGHSLGGHLAMLAQRLFPSTFNDVVTVNAVTFYAPPFAFPGSPNAINSETILSQFGQWNESKILRMESVGDGVSEIGRTYPGLTLTVGMETRPSVLDTVTTNHSVANVADGLALTELMGKLDARYMSDPRVVKTLFDAASNTPGSSYETLLDGLRKIIQGSAQPATSLDNPAADQLSATRKSFYDNIKTLSESSAYLAGVGKLTLTLADSTLATRAKTDFGAFLSLNALSPVVISTTDTTALAQLKQVNETLAQQWEADTQLSANQRAQGFGNFTDSWISDRVAILGYLIQANQQDLSGPLSVSGAQGMHFKDIASDKELDIGLPNNVIEKRQTLFGGEGADQLQGKKLEDHLYGGAGDDTLDGKAGADYLEGGTGVDTYQFSDTFGNDIILDSDGLGAIKLGSTTLTGGKRLAEGVWESDDKTLVFRQQSSASGVDLLIGQRTAVDTVTGTITIKNWQSGQLGLNLPAASSPTPPPVALTRFDLSTQAGANALLDADTSHSTQDLLVQNAGAAIYWGDAAAPVWSSSSVRTGSGADVIEGGAINAVTDSLYGGGAGADRIYANTTISLTDAIARGDNPSTVSIDSSHYVLDGGAGNDQIIGSDARDVIFGGAGDDTLVGGAGGDIIIADGNAGFLMVGSIADPHTQGFIVDGAPTTLGNTASLLIDHAGVVLGASISDSTGRRQKFEANRHQSLNPLFSADFTALQNLDDTDIRGLGYSYDGVALTPDQAIGQHTQYLGANDVSPLATNKETGNDVIYAGAGDDVVNAGAGNDIVLAGEGNDMVAGYEGDDYIDGGVGNDVLEGDSFMFGSGADYSVTPNIDFYSAKLLVNGYSLDTSGHGQDYIDGGAGNDQIEGGGKADLLYGGTGNDVIFGDDSTGRIYGSAAGNDVLDGGMGDDALFGGAGQDALTGGEDNDILIGDWLQDDFTGGGADTLDGGAGNDVLYGAAGADRLLGGIGNDVLRGDAIAVAVIGSFSVVLGRDIPVSAEAGDDYLDGGEGDDELFAEGGNDILIGGVGNDVLEGGSGEDDLKGGDGRDRLYGNEGRDTLSGGAGSDYLAGGAGDDTYIFGMGDAVPQENGDAVFVSDTIQDTQGKNVIRLDGVTLSDMGITKSGIAGSQAWALQFGLKTSVDGTVSGSNVVLIADGQVSRSIDVLEVGGQRIDFERYVGQYMQSVMQTSATQDGQYLLGGARSDALVLTKNDGVVVTGHGNDKITLGGKRNVIKIDRNDDDDVVTGDTTVASVLSASNAIQFGASIAASDLQISTMAGGAVLIKVTNGNASVTLKGGDVGELRFADGTPAADLAGLVQAYLNTKVTAGNDWVEGSLLADTVNGAAGDDFLFGNADNDILDGGAGQDNLNGGEGNDTLLSDGNDHLDGGAGDDLYHVTLSALSDGVNSAIGMVNDGLGLSTLVVENGPQDLNQYVMFRQGSGTFLAAGRAGVMALGADVDFAKFSIANAAGDRRTLAAVVAQQNPQGLLRTGTWSAQAGVQWTGAMATSQILRGGNLGDWLDGGSGNDQLSGLGGNDQLTGGAGRDILVGGIGINTYTFGVGDGIDVIRPTDGETGVLRFEGTPANMFRSLMVGNDLLINAGATDQVRIEGYSNNTQLAANWSVVIDGQVTTLGAFAAATDVPADTSLAARKQQFVEAQLTQLSTQAQYLSSSGWGDHAAPLAVTQSALQMDVGVSLELPSYLSRESIQTTVQHTNVVPIYESSSAPSPEPTYSFVPIASVHSALPAGYREVMGKITPDPNDASQSEWGIVGYMFPNQTQQNTDPVLVGWKTEVTTETITTFSDAAKQLLVQGTSADDVVRSSSDNPFRGVVETGQGDDSIVFASSTYDTATLRFESWMQEGLAPHGLGAWIDAGSGDDTIWGTDGDDFIIGGSGGDVLNGQAGADTYLISASGDDVDRIKDGAYVESLIIDVYGGQLNQDVVEFDSTVTLEDLSYRWNMQTGNSSLKTLELFQNDQLFLQIDYSQNLSYQVGAGVEQFKFSDGHTLSLDALLGMVPVKVASNPYGSNPYGNPYGSPYGTPAHSTFVLDASVLASTLSYQWVNLEDPGVITLALFQNGQNLVEFDYDSSVANAEQVTSIGGVTRFQFAVGESLTLQSLLSTIHLEPALPILGNPLPDVVAVEDSPFAMLLPIGTFSDPQGRLLHFAAGLQNGNDLPAWLHFDINTGQLTGTPDNEQVGELGIQVMAINDAGLAANVFFSLSILNTNDAPVSVTPLLNQDAQQGKVWQYEIPSNSFVDADEGDTLAYGAVLASGAALPGWLTFNAATQTFSGTPGSGNVGSVSIQVMATDAAGATASSSFSVNVMSLPVNQTLHADTQNTPLYGGSGDDTLYGSWFSSTLFGGLGNDTLIAQGGPNNVLDGGAGDDNLTGGWGQDILRGGEGNNTIHANGGNSVISAGAGNDVITSSWGNDIINAGDGNNQIQSGGGSNTITAGDGNDVIASEWGDDQIDAGDGNNTISAGGGFNTITSGSGHDVISADGGNLIHAGAGHDQISTGWGADDIDAGAGDDLIQAGGGGNTVRGGLGNDQILGAQWSDDRYLFARGDGQDLVADGGGQDRLVLEDVRAEQLWFSQSGNDLDVSVIGSQDHITLQNWYLGNQYHVEQFETSDGKTLLDSQVQNLVNAMASFAPPAAGQTTLAANYAAALAPVIVANWQ